MILASVAVVSCAALLGWRWHLAHVMALRALEARDTDAALKSLPALFKSLDDRVGALEWKTSGKR